MRYFLALVLVWLAPATLRAEGLMGLRWSSPQQLEELSKEPVRVRYIAPGIVLLGGDEKVLRELGARGFESFFVDRKESREAYFITEHLRDPLPPGLVLVYRDPSGWALLRMAREQLAAAREQLFFLWPLPQRCSLKGWQPSRRRAKPTRALAAATVADLLARVDIQRLEKYTEDLALLDPQAPSTPDNWRTRFVLRPETLEATEYIRSQMAAALGEDAVEVHKFGVVGSRAARFLGVHTRDLGPDEVPAYNVIGTLPGSNPELGYYIVSAHYDAIGTRTRGGWDWRTEPAPGADDNATGVALVLESARLLADQHFPWAIRFIAFSGEELGLIGSEAYAREARARGDNILGVLNFDMVGFNDITLRMQLVTNPASRWLVEQMIESNQRYDIGLHLDVLQGRGASLGLSDHAPFWVQGYDAMLGIENYLPIDSTSVGVRQGLYRLNTQYHTIFDVPDSVNWELVRRTTQLALATLGQYALEEGEPNLAVFTGDLRGDVQNNLSVRVSNIGLGELMAPYGVRVSRCGMDSTHCEVVFEEEGAAPLAPGAAAELSVPWKRFGEMVFLVEVDPQNRIPEASEDDNRTFQRLRLVPQRDIVVFPNPFRPDKERFVAFSGVPLRARVRIADMSGQLVWSAAEERQGNLTHEIRWSGQNQSGFAVASGVYIYTIATVGGKLLKRDKIAVLR